MRGRNYRWRVDRVEADRTRFRINVYPTRKEAVRVAELLVRTKGGVYEVSDSRIIPEEVKA